MAATEAVFVKTYGCQMNVYDSERMTAALAARGLRADRPTPDDADLILLNTCHIREKAAEKVYSELGRLRRLKAAASPGCASASPAASPRPRARRSWRARRSVDLVVGPQAYHRLPAMLDRRGGGRAAGRDRLPAGGQVRPPAAGPARAAGAGGVPDGAGGLRQVLRLLRRALHPRRRGLAPGGAGRGRGARSGRRAAWSRSPCSARTSTPTATRTGRAWRR